MPAESPTPRDRPDRRVIAVVAAGLIVLGLLLWFASPRADIRPPTLSDLPFHALAAVRQFLLNLADRSATILAAAGAAGLVLLWVVSLARHRARAAAAASLLVVGALAAVQAQVAVHQFHTDTALALYLIAGALFCAWLFLTRRAGIPRVAISRRL